MTPRARLAAILAVALPLAVLAALALTVLDRPGYSPDEELTAVIVTGISQSGAPLLPSGVLYNRGLPYSYLAWAAAELGGGTLLSFRVASLLCAAAALITVVTVGRRLGNTLVGASAGLLLASFPAFVAAAVFARAYAALVFCALLFVAVFWRWLSGNGTARAPLIALAIAALLHPAGAALALIPWLSLAAGNSRDGLLRMAGMATGVTVAALGAGYGAHFVSLALTGTPFSAESAIYAIPSVARPPLFSLSLVGATGWFATTVLFVTTAAVLIRGRWAQPWIVLVCAALAAPFQLGALLIAVTVGLLSRPALWRDWLRAGTVTTIVAVTWWPVFIAPRATAQLSLDFAANLAFSSLAYPLSHLQYTATLLPALSVLGSLAVAFAVRRNDTSSQYVRAIAVFVLLCLVGFDVMGIPVTERYLLLPWSFLILLASFASMACVDAATRLVRARGRMRAGALPVAAALALLAAGVGHYRFALERAAERAGETPAVAMLAPRTGTWDPARFRGLISATDTVVCTEELACLYLLGRADYLFTLQTRDIEDYVSIRSGQRVGFYASRPVIWNESDLNRVFRRRDGCTVVVSLNTGKIGFGMYSEMAARVGRPDRFHTVVESADTFVGRACSIPGEEAFNGT